MKNEFIAWDKKKKCFIPSCDVAINGNGIVHRYDRILGVYVQGGHHIEIFDYSGKVDRIGAKLYRGDIIKAELPLSEGRYEKLSAKTIIGVVVIRPSEGARILVKKIIPNAAGISKGRTIRIKQDQDIKIGHIYTNPELIEEE